MKDILKNSPFFISEIGLNHNGNVKTAEDMIIKSAESGAHAVKFQTFIPEMMNSIYTKNLLENGEDRIPDDGVINFLKQFVLSKKELAHLKSVADSEGVIFFSAPFDMESLEILSELDTPLFKIASSEITNLPLLKAVADTGKPVIISTGMSSENEISEALEIFSEKNTDAALLHCVSLYPTPKENANLRRISTLKSIFQCDIGISDHSSEIINSVIAASLGSTIFEKHFIPTSEHECPDAAVSITPELFREMTKTVKEVVVRLGDGAVYKKSGEDDVAIAARRSIFAGRTIKSGEIISMDMLKFQRPGTGIPVNMLDEITGRRANRDIEENKILKEDYLN